MKLTKVLLAVLITLLRPMGTIHINSKTKQRQLLQLKDPSEDMILYTPSGIVDSPDNYTNNVASDFLANPDPQPPIIIYGGMGSPCDNEYYLRMKQIVKNQTGAYVDCYTTDLLGSIESQAEDACSQLKNDTHFNSVQEINVFGISQGGLVGRYIVENCLSLQDQSQPKVRNLLNVGTPNMGI